MLRSMQTRFDLDPLRDLLFGDQLRFRAEDDDAGAGGSGGGGSSQEDDDDGDGAGGTGGADGDGSGSDGDDDSDDEADVRVRRANRQAAKSRVALKEEKEKREALEARLLKLEGGSSDGDESKAKLEQAEQTRREAEERASKAERKLARIERERVVTSVAKSLGFSDPDIVVALVESGQVEDLDPEEELTREDVKLALKDLKKAKPHLLGDSSTREGDGGNGRGRGTNGTRRDRGDEAIDKLPLGQRAHARLTRAFSEPK